MTGQYGQPGAVLRPGTVRKLRNTADLLRTVESLEAELDLFSLTLHGCQVWHYARYTVVRALAMEFNLAPPRTRRGSSPLTYLKLLGYCLRPPRFWRRHKLLVFGHSRRRKQADGTYADIYIDPWVHSVGVSHEQIEYNFQGTHLSPPSDSTVRFGELLNLVGRLSALARPTKLGETDAQQLRQIEEVFEKTLGRPTGLRAHLLRCVSMVNAYKPVYSWFLRRVKPELVLLVEANGVVKSIVVQAARELGICTAELQHGLVDRYHPGYHCPNCSPGKRIGFAEYFLSFGEFWLGAAKLPVALEKVVAVGWPYLDAQVASYGSVAKKHQVLIVSQSDCGAQVAELALELARKAPRDMSVVLKLHPADVSSWRTLYPNLASSPGPLKIVSGDNPPTHRLLAESEYVVGVYSTLLYESLRYRCNLILWDAPGVDCMERLRKKYGVPLCRTSHEVFRAMHTYHAKLPDPQQVFRGDASRNILRFVAERCSSDTNRNRWP